MSNITELNLLHVPLESDYKHTIYFNDKKAQEDYFKSKAIYKDLTYTDFSYQRKEHKIRVPNHFDNLSGKVNYVMYKNKAYSNKWFYAFIVDIEYVNDAVSDVYIQTDVIQTWMFDYTLKSCFVEREHVKDDTIGKHTVPEMLETGEYICNNTINDTSMDSTRFIVASAVNLETGADSNIRLYNGVLNGWYYYCFSTVAEVREALSDIATLRSNDAIVSIFIMPTKFIHLEDGDNRVVESHDVPKYDLFGYDDDNTPIEKPTDVNGYVPKNNKLLTYPYSYLLIDNNAGATATYHYELFEDKTHCGFMIYGCITPGGSLRLIPSKYNGTDGKHYGLNSGKFPVCGWQSDYYTNWLTQNALNIEVQTEGIKLSGLQNAVNNAFDTGKGASASIMSGDVVGGLTTAVQGGVNSYFIAQQQLNQIKGITAMKEMHAFQSPTVSGNIASGDINYCMGNIRFSAYQMSIKEEYARIIDNYFSMYGYQVNRVKTPNKNHRALYWYTKTVGCEIDGAIPNKDMQIIKTCYDSGITFWKNPTMIGKYTDAQDNLYENKIV